MLKFDQLAVNVANGCNQKTKTMSEERLKSPVTCPVRFEGNSGNCFNLMFVSSNFKMNVGF